jgi:hypothetical protein
MELSSQRSSGAISDADGSSFHRRQLFEQDCAIFLALESFRSELETAQGRAA